MSRALAREMALQLLYQLDSNPESPERQIESFLIERLGTAPTEAYLEQFRAASKRAQKSEPKRQPTKAPQVYRRKRRDLEEAPDPHDASLPGGERDDDWDPYLPISEDEDQQAKLSERDVAYFTRLVEHVHGRRPELDLLYAPFLKAWTPSRLPRIDRSILRIATYEIYYVDDVPLAVAVNEAVELAHRFADDDAPAYINAVLGNMSERQPRPPAETEEPLPPPEVPELSGSGDGDGEPPEETPDAPEEVPGESPDVTPDQPATMPGETPQEVPGEAPAEVPAESPEEAPDVPPAEVPDETPDEVPAERPEDIPAETSPERPGGVPQEAYPHTPSEMPAQAPTELPADGPTEIPTEIPTGTPDEVPSDIGDATEGHVSSREAGNGEEA